MFDSVAADLQTRRGGCSIVLRWICNPTQINIKICNLQK